MFRGGKGNDKSSRVLHRKEIGRNSLNLIWKASRDYIHKIDSTKFHKSNYLSRYTDSILRTNAKNECGDNMSERIKQ